MVEPEWIGVLRAHASAHGQKASGRAIGYSGSYVCSIINGKITSGLDAVQQAVEGALMGKTVDCPVIGDIPRNRCLEHQAKPFAATSPMRVALSRACPTCPNRRAAS
jgi:hypothetical protein